MDKSVMGLVAAIAAAAPFATAQAAVTPEEAAGRSTCHRSPSCSTPFPIP